MCRPLPRDRALKTLPQGLRSTKRTPPKPHTEASLLSAMERAGNEDTDPDAERRGLGTPATRAAVIEKLVKAALSSARANSYFPTKDGINLVCVCR